MVLSFIVFWPVGLALLVYLIWSGRMGCWRHGRCGRWQEPMDAVPAANARQFRGWCSRAAGAAARSGNVAFDEYRDETLRRLEEEQREFRDFLDRLRQAKDKAEFDQFMNERRNRPPAPEPPPAASPPLKATYTSPPGESREGFLCQ